MTQTPTAAGLDAHIVVRRPDGFALDVEFAIAPGETIALLGPNGAGKSTTVRALAGITPLDGGHITLAGRTLDNPSTSSFVAPDERNIGIVFQDYLLFDHLTVTENVAFGVRARGARRSDAAAAARHWIDALGLAAFAHRRPPQLSGGQAQRVALARALAIEPDLFPHHAALAALDIGTRSELRRTLSRHLSQFAGPRLLITHDPTDAFLLADIILVLEEGRLTQMGSPEDIRRRPATPYAAALAGTNLLGGTNAGGTLTLDGHAQPLQTSETHVEGPVLITIHPNAIALHREQPHGSPRNTWQTTVASVEPLGDTTRITLGDPLPLGVDVTPASTTALALAPGVAIWASVKATEIEVTPSA